MNHTHVQKFMIDLVCNSCNFQLKKMISSFFSSSDSNNKQDSNDFQRFQTKDDAAFHFMNDQQQQQQQQYTPSPLSAQIIPIKTPEYYEDYEFGIEEKKKKKDEHEDEPLTMIELWASDVLDCSSYWDGSAGGGHGFSQSVSYGPRNVIGPSTIYPNAGSHGSAWCPNTTTGPGRLISNDCVCVLTH